MLVRLLLLAAAIWFGLRLYRQWRLGRNRVDAARPPDAFERMVRCTRCGVHLPVSAVSPDGRCGKCSG